MIAIFFIFHYKTRFSFKNAYGSEILEEESEGESEESKRGREIKGEKENVCVRERERERERREGREERESAALLKHALRRCGANINGKLYL